MAGGGGGGARGVQKAIKTTTKNITYSKMKHG